MTRQRAIMNRILLAAPWLTIGVMLGMSWLLPNRAEFSPQAEARKAEVAQAMEDVPFFIGRWVGADAPVPREAQKLLHTNAMLSRSYQAPGSGDSVHVLVVHCGDARDMLGHYPPVCYPSTGWEPHEFAEAPDVVLEVRGVPLPVRQYMFRAVRERGKNDVIRIFNAFVLPDGTVTREYADINRQSERLQVAVQGVAQVQIITSGAAPATQAIETAQEIISGMPRLLQALGVPQGDST